MSEKIFSISIPLKSWELVTKLAQKAEVSRSSFVKEALAEYINKHFGDKVKPSQLLELTTDKRFTKGENKWKK